MTQLMTTTQNALKASVCLIHHIYRDIEYVAGEPEERDTESHRWSVTVNASLAPETRHFSADGLHPSMRRALYASPDSYGLNAEDAMVKAEAEDFCLEQALGLERIGFAVNLRVIGEK